MNWSAGIIGAVQGAAAGYTRAAERTTDAMVKLSLADMQAKREDNLERLRQENKLKAITHTGEMNEGLAAKDRQHGSSGMVEAITGRPVTRAELADNPDLAVVSVKEYGAQVAQKYEKPERQETRTETIFRDGKEVKIVVDEAGNELRVLGDAPPDKSKDPSTAINQHRTIGVDIIERGKKGEDVTEEINWYNPRAEKLGAPTISHQKGKERTFWFDEKDSFKFGTPGGNADPGSDVSPVDEFLRQAKTGELPTDGESRTEYVTKSPIIGQPDLTPAPQAAEPAQQDRGPTLGSTNMDTLRNMADGAGGIIGGAVDALGANNERLAENRQRVESGRAMATQLEAARRKAPRDQQRNLNAIIRKLRVGQELTPEEQSLAQQILQQ